MKADSKKVMRLLKTARGQLDGILRMAEEDRYCIDIVNQILATQSVLRKCTRDILHAHLQNCVKEAFEQDQEAEKRRSWCIN